MLHQQKQVNSVFQKLSAKGFESNNMAVIATLVSTFICMFILFHFIKLLDTLWWTPARIKSIMGAQGVKGPPYKLLFGNVREMFKMIFENFNKPMEDMSHDLFPRILPYVYSWQKTYGWNFMYWLGPQAAMVIKDSELIKAILSNNDEAFPKADFGDVTKRLFGDGLVASSGEKWKKVRNLANPAFHGESLKGMFPTMITSTVAMLERWEEHDEGKEIEVFQEFKQLTSEIISQTAFGVNYSKGNDVLDLLEKLSKLTFLNMYRIRIPFFSKIFKHNDDIELEKLEKEIRDSMISMVNDRKKMAMYGKLDDYGNDFLGLLIKANQSDDTNKKITVDDLIDECKTIYVGGSETTNAHLAWTMLLLATHTDWQDEARKEVFGLFGKQNPTSDGITRLKTVNMITNESLRLYPPACMIMRRVSREIKVGKFIFPANLNILFPILAIHHDPNIWGEDAHLFKPERFSGGVAKATTNNLAAFLPFSSGPRICIGYNFAYNETKIALSMILQRYKFTLSPNYVHWPESHLTVQPRHGVKIILHRVQSSEYLG